MINKCLPGMLSRAGSDKPVALGPHRAWGKGTRSRPVPRRHLRLVSASLLIPFLLSCVPVEAAEVRGTVRLKGPVPAQERVKIEPKKGVHSTEGCGSLEKASQKLTVSPSGGIRNAVVWLDEPGGRQGEAEAAPEPTRVDQKECLFEPHVVALPPAGEIAIRNSDTVIHNIRIFREGEPSMLMHQWQKADGPDIRWQFAEPGRYVVRCGVHPWMYGWVVVLPHRMSAVTDAEGRFLLAGVPEGRRRLRIWHETLGEREVAVEVRGSEVQMEPVVLQPAGD